MKATINLQDYYLNSIRKENSSATFFLINGFQIKGRVVGFDNFIVVIDSDGKQQMVYKHAISTILPIRSVSFDWLEQATEEQEANL